MPDAFMCDDHKFQVQYDSLVADECNSHSPRVQIRGGDPPGAMVRINQAYRVEDKEIDGRVRSNKKLMVA